MTVWRLVRPALAGALLLSGMTAFAAPAQAPRFIALDTMQQGMWQLRETGGGARATCVRDPAALFQLRGNGAQCSRFVIENTATTATVHYTCPGRGHGRTTISVETPRLVRIESEGIDNGAPFSLELEGRRTGSCPAN
ncbi:DUF3617 domain-containing protein [Sphingomonas sp.]|uniref:DUF3617 domain-containing protein n=1 Tax=Sphingomonas sp. TaxID=28214 RepID=UPI002DD622E2|nr:hypothetical protein [Sphingomonas sp.]